jgi:O-antigen biosynthesis protein
MGEIFRRERAEYPEPFTGERFTAAVTGQILVEHYHRYLFARSRVAELDVLDVASGEGYGAALLAQVARSVVGIECCDATVRSAARSFPRRNLHFLQGDARRLPLADASLDVVVSFETIEHFDRQGDFLREVQRVLRPGGSFIVSTPDRDVYSPTAAPVNPFHVCEMTRLEFLTLLQSRFRHVQIMQQRAIIGSALLPETGSVAWPQVFDRRGDTHFEACAGLPRAPYLVAVASDDEPAPFSVSLYVHRSDLETDPARILTLEDQVSRVLAALSEAAARTAEATARTAEATARAAAATEQAAGATERADHAERLRAYVEQRLRVTEQKLQALDRVQGSLRLFVRGYLPRLRRHLVGSAAIAPLALLERPHRTQEIDLAERRPQHVGEVELAVAALPEQKA